MTLNEQILEVSKILKDAKVPTSYRIVALPCDEEMNLPPEYQELLVQMTARNYLEAFKKEVE